VVCVWSDRPCIQLQLASSLPLLNKAEISVIYINVKIITFFAFYVRVCFATLFLGYQRLAHAKFGGNHFGFFII